MTTVALICGFCLPGVTAAVTDAGAAAQCCNPWFGLFQEVSLTVDDL
jgi:hypothetical protein